MAASSSPPAAGSKAVSPESAARSGEPVGRRDDRTQPSRERVVEGAGGRLPGPVALSGAGGVHPALAAEAEEVLGRYDAQPRGRLQGEADQRPGHRLVGTGQAGTDLL